MAKAKKPAKTPRSIYGVHPSVKMIADWIDSMKEKTGRSLMEWIKLAKENGPKDEEALRDWFKTRHGFGTNAAWWLAERTFDKGWADGDPQVYLKQSQQFLNDMYSGNKAGLKPIHDALLETAAELGEDVKACPCQTVVPIFRKHVIAQIKPATKTRIDLGLALARYSAKAPARLIDTGGKDKGDRITHRIPITKVEEIDAEVKRWLRIAYDLDA